MLTMDVRTDETESMIVMSRCRDIRRWRDNLKTFRKGSKTGQPVWSGKATRTCSNQIKYQISFI